MKKQNYFFILLLFASAIANSQSRFFGGVATGFMYYNGDLNDKRLVPPTKIFNTFYNFTVGYNIDRHLDIRFNYYHGKVEGADSLANENDNILRNLSFQSKIDEFSIGIYLKLFDIRDKRSFNPYVFAGFGYFFFNPKAEYNGEMIALQPLGTEGQYITETSNHPKPYKLSKTVFPLGIGVNVRLNDYWKLKFEFAEHFTTTDYLDDASGKYPDSLSLSYTPNGALAVALSNRREGYKYPSGNSRGNTHRKDNYVHFGVGIIYNPRRKHANDFGHNGFFKRLFSGRKGWWGKHGKGLE